MIQANISTAKNSFSAYLKKVSRGETILILDRDEPVAILSPYRAITIEQKGKDRIALLSKHGKITLPRCREKHVLPPPIITAKPANLVQALLEERASGR